MFLNFTRFVVDSSRRLSPYCARLGAARELESVWLGKRTQGIGAADFLPGGLQFASDFRLRAREAERDPVYTCDELKSAKSLLI